MRSFVCGQCHVEYYCGPKMTLFFPWEQGPEGRADRAHYDDYKFPDGHRFYDWKHAETGAEVLKAQHPEFEMWSQGIHARSGVACADCHMPYKREGAMKVSDHWVRSPLLNISRACQTCHPYAEAEIQARVDAIQERTHDAARSARRRRSMDMLDAIVAAKKAGATAERARAGARAAAQGAVAARLRRRGELDGLPRAAGGGAHPGRGDRLRAPGRARRADGGRAALSDYGLGMRSVLLIIALPWRPKTRASGCSVMPAQRDGAEGELVLPALQPGQRGEQAHQQQAAGDGKALEVVHLAGASRRPPRRTRCSARAG